MYVGDGNKKNTYIHKLPFENVIQKEFSIGLKVLIKKKKKTFVLHINTNMQLTEANETSTMKAARSCCEGGSWLKVPTTFSLPVFRSFWRLPKISFSYLFNTYSCTIQSGFKI